MPKIMQPYRQDRGQNNHYYIGVHIESLEMVSKEEDYLLINEVLNYVKVDKDHHTHYEAVLIELGTS